LYEIQKFIEVARRMMERRHVELTEEASRLLEDAFAASGSRTK
jgi:hypothetical protein